LGREREGKWEEIGERRGGGEEKKESKKDKRVRGKNG
jgi:hypothetical protein